mgnify:FL=1
MILGLEVNPTRGESVALIQRIKLNRALIIKNISIWAVLKAKEQKWVTENDDLQEKWRLKKAIAEGIG